MYASQGDAVGMVASASAHWSGASIWTGGGIRREVFFFRSAGQLLYGSLFAADSPSRRFGVVLCNSWGVEADRCDPLQRSVALEAAKRGGAGLVFHYPGYGDSFGDLAGVDMAELSQAAVDAVAEASRRCPGLSWVLAGLMLGASVACLAQERAGAERLLLVQPAVQPGAYFRRLGERTQPLALPSAQATEAIEAGPPDMAYGYPIPARIVDDAATADAAVAAALTAFSGVGAIVRHAKPAETPAMPERFERAEVPGAWRFGSRNNPDLAQAATEWLNRHAGDDTP